MMHNACTIGENADQAIAITILTLSNIVSLIWILKQQGRR